MLRLGTLAPRLLATTLFASCLMALSACQVVGKLTEDNSPEARRARRQKAKEDEAGNQREVALKKMTSSRTGFIGSKTTAAKGGGGILRPKGGPGGGAPPQPTSPVQKVIAEVRSAVVGPVDSTAAVARRNALLATATPQRGLFTMTDSGGTFRPCGVAKKYMMRGSQEAVYLINERFRFAMRQIDRAVYIEVLGVINDTPGQGGGAPAGGQAKDGAGAASAPAGRRRPAPFIYVTKFLNMTAARPRDCTES